MIVNLYALRGHISLFKYFAHFLKTKIIIIIAIELEEHLIQFGYIRCLTPDNIFSPL